jgi:hypothetical protein
VVRRTIDTSAGRVGLAFAGTGVVEIVLYDEADSELSVESWPEADLAKGIAVVAGVPLAEAEAITERIRADWELEGAAPRAKLPRRYHAGPVVPIALAIFAALTPFLLVYLFFALVFEAY